MDNYLLLEKEEALSSLSTSLGFSNTFFRGTDFEIVLANSSQDLLVKAKALKQKKKLVFYKPTSEDLLRFALEKAPIDGVILVEEIHPTNSVHFIRGGLDQVLCTIAAANGKAVVFSFSSVLNSPARAKLLGRMIFNFSLCRKYGVKTIFSNFSQEKMEMRSSADLQAFERILQKSL